MHIIAGKDC